MICPVCGGSGCIAPKDVARVCPKCEGKGYLDLVRMTEREKLVWKRFKISVEGERGSFDILGYERLTAQIELLDKQREEANAPCTAPCYGLEPCEDCPVVEQATIVPEGGA